MKKLLFVLLSVVLLSACGDAAAKSKETNSRFSGGDDRITIIVDQETNCKYLGYDALRKGALTPLLKSDGTPDCDE